MAIGMHVRYLKRDTAVSDGTIIVEDSGGNSTGNPAIEDYLQLEAADNFLPTYINDRLCVTVDVGDMNAAT